MVDLVQSLTSTTLSFDECKSDLNDALSRVAALELEVCLFSSELVSYFYKGSSIDILKIQMENLEQFEEMISQRDKLENNLRSCQTELESSQAELESSQRKQQRDIERQTETNRALEESLRQV